jgi:hypothetical protein
MGKRSLPVSTVFAAAPGDFHERNGFATNAGFVCCPPHQSIVILQGLAARDASFRIALNEVNIPPSWFLGLCGG